MGLSMNLEGFLIVIFFARIKLFLFFFKLSVKFCSVSFSVIAVEIVAKVLTFYCWLWQKSDALDAPLLDSSSGYCEEDSRDCPTPNQDQKEEWQRKWRRKKVTRDIWWESCGSWAFTVAPFLETVMIYKIQQKIHCQASSAYVRFSQTP